MKRCQSFSLFMRYAIVSFVGIVLLSCRSLHLPAVALTHTTVLTADGNGLRPDSTILISRNRISAIGPSDSVSLPHDAQVVDGTGKYVIPGLWDMHVHLNLLRTFDDAELSGFVATGLTGVRDMGGPMPAIREWRARMSAGQLLSPTIVAAGPILVGSKRGEFERWVTVVHDARVAHGIVDAVLASGADFIKLTDWLTSDVYEAIAVRTRERRVPLVGHVPVAVGTEAVVDAGQRDIEHLGNIYGGILLDCSNQEERLRGEMLQRYAQDGVNGAIAYAFSAEFMAALVDSYDALKAASLLSRLKEHEVWQVPTLVLHRANSEGRADGEGRLSSPEVKKQVQRLYAKQLALVRDMHAAGIPILAGTDKWWVQNPVTEDTIHDELELLVEAGLAPADALRSATSEPARFLGRRESIGTIETGKVADLLVIDGNPLEDIRNTRRISTVVHSGIVINEHELNRLHLATMRKK
jgi:hypothetical protein